MAGGVQVRGKKRRLNAEINVVPYIDVMLVLLVIFMVTAPLMTQGIDVELPQTSSDPMQQDEAPVTFYVARDGSYHLDIGKGVDASLGDDEVTAQIGAVLRNKPQTMVLVKADQGVDYGRVVKGMALLQAGGATKIGFVTDPQSGSPQPNPRARKPG
jgi:biopolymer transport protein TolR